MEERKFKPGNVVTFECLGSRTHAIVMRDLGGLAFSRYRIFNLTANAVGEMDSEDLEFFAENIREAVLRATETTKNRLEELRTALREECISYGGLAELQSLAKFIEPGDLELLEAAGVYEEPADDAFELDYGKLEDMSPEEYATYVAENSNDPALRKNPA
jgi:hypothetical protein